MRERHGKRKTPEYRAWVDMRLRCYHPERLDYVHYGGRGIEVCERWKDSFVAFYNDMGDRPTDTHSLDRIDNDGNYEPDNCRWGTKKHQSRNRRMLSNNTSGVTGVSWDKRYEWWQASIYCNKKLIHLGTFVDKNKAVQARKKGESTYW